MKKKLMMALSLVLVAALSIGGTIAYLTDQTEPVTNAFTVGNIDITLTETTTDYKIVPGGKDAKDPTITVKKGSEACYVYAYIKNTVAVGDNVVATPNIGKDWVLVAGKTSEGLYRYTTIVDAVEVTDDIKVPVFTEVTYAGTIASTDMEDLDGKTIVVQGYAHQSSNVEQTVADTAAMTQFGFVVSP